MNLQIRDERAYALARALAEKTQSSVESAVISALEAELSRLERAMPLGERIGAIADDLLSKRGSGGRRMSKAEIDAMWSEA